MISSMTAYAQVTANGLWGNLVWEIRSVNHRYLEQFFKIPEEVRDLEFALREVARQSLARGKLDCCLKLTLIDQDQQLIELNLPFIQQLITASNQISNLIEKPAPVSPLELLRWPGAIVNIQTDKSELHKVIRQGFVQAIEKLKQARYNEGAALLNIINTKLDCIEQQVAIIREKLPEILVQLKANLISKIEGLNLTLDNNRLEQEYVYLLQKSDISEELERLAVHVNEFKRVLSNENAVGRKLDFLLQEMNREANTLASKSIASLTSLAAVELKVLIEQIREQVQNLE